jgi:hypothetical protein
MGMSLGFLTAKNLCSKAMNEWSHELDDDEESRVQSAQSQDEAPYLRNGPAFLVIVAYISSSKACLTRIVYWV